MVVRGQILPWDSTFFGHKVARAEIGGGRPPDLNDLLDWCQAESVGLLYLLAPFEHASFIRRLEANQFNLVDIRVLLSLDLTRRRPDSVAMAEEVMIRPAKPEDLATLRPIAARVHRDSRFYFDPHIGQDRASSLFVKWIEASCADGFADLVLVAEVDGSAEGYITGNLGQGAGGSIGLVGVAEKAQGRGVGSALVLSMLQRLLARGSDRTTVVTQGRKTAAQRFYQRCGFEVDSVGLWYHKWF